MQKPTGPSLEDTTEANILGSLEKRQRRIGEC